LLDEYEMRVVEPGGVHLSRCVQAFERRCIGRCDSTERLPSEWDRRQDDEHPGQRALKQDRGASARVARTLGERV
jgi:hypothetical protein